MKKQTRPSQRIPKTSFIIALIVMVPVGFILGLWGGSAVITLDAVRAMPDWLAHVIEYGLAVAGAILGIALSAPLYLLLDAISRKVESSLTKYSSKEILMGIVGLVLGVLLAVLIGLLLDIPNEGIRSLVGVCLGMLLGYVGMRIGARMLYDLLPATNLPRPAHLTSRAERDVVVLDSSSLIDGRVLDIVRTGFLGGKLVIANDVLMELSRIADSDDELKQNRGRRGLDIVTALQKEKNVSVKIFQLPAQAASVDDAVLAAAQEANGRIITNDANFARLAHAQNIEVLNVNDLGNALRPIALPGEKMQVRIVKLGKEAGQGLAYTPDGTMIVVENGADKLGKEVETTVTTSLQTSSGRIVFVRS